MASAAVFLVQKWRWLGQGCTCSVAGRVPELTQSSCPPRSELSASLTPAFNPIILLFLRDFCSA